MSTSRDVQHISVFINRPPDVVYAFAANPENLPLWAAGLARSELRKEQETWIAEAPFGTVKIRFVATNTLGVMDHEVELESGLVVYNPMRVVPNGQGSEFIFSLLRQPDMSDEAFAADKEAIEADLATLKALLETQ